MGSSVRTPLVERLPPSSAPTIPLLRVVAGSDMLRFAVLEKGRGVEIGREAGSDLMLSDASVSRKHARLAFAGGEFPVEDGGRNRVEKASPSPFAPRGKK